jgi:hypothetical protein
MDDFLSTALPAETQRPKSLRDLAGLNVPYYDFNREERHLGAILFHLLNRPGNVDRLFALADIKWLVEPKEFGIYFEYSYLRDLWHALGQQRTDANAVKLAAIQWMLKRQGFDAALCDELGQLGTKKFNEQFIGPQCASKGSIRRLPSIQSPANWRLAEFVPRLSGNADVVAACKIKWAFKAKPDLVIHVDREHVVCLELKLESDEGTYPASGSEKTLLRARGLFAEGRTRPFPMSQRDIQRLALEDLLGLEYKPVYVTRNGDNGSDILSWRRLFKNLDCSQVSPFMAAAIERASK